MSYKHASHVDPVLVNNARSVYAKAFGFGPLDFLQGELPPSKFSPQSGLRHHADSHLALPQIFSLVCIFFKLH